MFRRILILYFLLSFFYCSKKMCVFRCAIWGRHVFERFCMIHTNMLSSVVFSMLSAPVVWEHDLHYSDSVCCINCVTVNEDASAFWVNRCFISMCFYLVWRQLECYCVHSHKHQSVLKQLNKAKAAASIMHPKRVFVYVNSYFLPRCF